MVFKSIVEWGGTLRAIFIGSMFVGALTLGACSSSEEMTEEEGFEETPAMAEEGQAEEQKEENADQQALTSFIGAAPKKEEPKEEPKAEPEPPVTRSATTTPADDLQTENTSLKQKVVKLEQDVRSLSARLSDSEAKYMAEKDRADKAEAAAKVAAQSAAISARGAQITEPVSEMSMGSYEDALAAFNSRNYDAAINQLQSMINSGIPRELEDNCHYWIGESNFGKKNYSEAMKHFEMVFQYQKSEKHADAQFMLAQCYDRTGNKTKAKEAYERVVKDFPTSRNVERARERSARL